TNRIPLNNERVISFLLNISFLANPEKYQTENKKILAKTHLIKTKSMALRPVLGATKPTVPKVAIAIMILIVAFLFTAKFPNMYHIHFMRNFNILSNKYILNFSVISIELIMEKEIPNS
ncbi:hypothetical protein, partial [Bacillus sp. AFS001701]|uniref:hypothetical protein n=1 Tax=Bacillus sp. AFS001701 TaxID=2033480 RepID=UPI001596B5AB